VKRLLGIGLIALAGLGLVACGDDDDEEPTATEPAISIETPGAETTTPTAPEPEATETAPPGEATETAPQGGEKPSGKPSKRKGKSKGQGGETADLPKCDEVGGGPAPCRRDDGSVRVPERL